MGSEVGAALNKPTTKNTPLMSLMSCLFEHFVALRKNNEDNQRNIVEVPWSNMDPSNH